jgi:putative alpha-1,2-mannosidase
MSWFTSMVNSTHFTTTSCYHCLYIISLIANLFHTINPRACGLDTKSVTVRRPYHLRASIGEHKEDAGSCPISFSFCRC